MHVLHQFADMFPAMHFTQTSDMFSVMHLPLRACSRYSAQHDWLQMHAFSEKILEILSNMSTHFNHGIRNAQSSLQHMFLRAFYTCPLIHSIASLAMNYPWLRHGSTCSYEHSGLTSKISRDVHRYPSAIDFFCPFRAPLSICTVPPPWDVLPNLGRERMDIFSFPSFDTLVNVLSRHVHSNI